MQILEKRGGPTTHRSHDRNLALIFSSKFCLPLYLYKMGVRSTYTLTPKPHTCGISLGLLLYLGGSDFPLLKHKLNSAMAASLMRILCETRKPNSSHISQDQPKAPRQDRAKLNHLMSKEWKSSPARRTYFAKGWSEIGKYWVIIGC